mgnify:CR=1 FL=1
MEIDIKPKKDVKKIIKMVFKIIYQILVIFCVILTAVIILQRVTSSNKSIAGYRIFRVISGSMEPEYDVGEVVISKETDPEKIKVGDDIVYLGRYGEYNGKIIMHNVIAIDTDESGNLRFHAKGLHAYSVEDPQITASQIFGVVKYKSNILTILYKLATNIYSVFFIVIVLVIAFNSSKGSKIQTLNEANSYSDDDDDENEEYYEEDDEEEEEEEEEVDTEDELEDDEDNNDDTEEE